MSSRRPLGGPGYPVVEAAERAIRRYNMFEEGATLVVAVSGGPDSMCLLDVLRRVSLEPELVVAHVDHGISEESDAVAARVAAHGSEAGLDVHVVRVGDLEGPNLQARARGLRYAFFESLAEKVGATKIATGHTLDDRVETTLARLIHGAATEVLAGIAPVDELRVRPLLDLRRAETRNYCDEVGIPYYDDPANEDPRFERVRVRAMLGAIEDEWGSGAVRAMAASAERLREDSATLASLADRLFREIASVDEDGTRLPLDALLDMSRAFRRRLLELAVGRVRDRSGGIDAALEALERPDVGAEKKFAVATGIAIFIGPKEVSISRMDE